jgi:Uma2 family endonuclease
MSAASLAESAAAAPVHRSAVVIEDDIQIPGWVGDLESFRRWAWSDEFPERGRFSYLLGAVWADVSMEEMFSHKQVKSAFAFAVMLLLRHAPSGGFVGDRTLLTSPAAGLATEPDGLFYRWETIRDGRLRRCAGTEGGVMELEGAPDMVLEVVGRSAVRKDTNVLRRLYWQAGVREYWLADARGDVPRFEILKHTATGYAAAEEENGWGASDVFGRSFRLTCQADPLGDPSYQVEFQSVGATEPAPHANRPEEKG